LETRLRRHRQVVQYITLLTKTTLVFNTRERCFVSQFMVHHQMVQSLLHLLSWKIWAMMISSQLSYWTVSHVGNRMWKKNYLAFKLSTLSVPDKGYSWNASCAR